MLTAYSSVVNCSPGQYQLGAVLKSLIHPYRLKGRHPRLPAKKRNQKGYRHKKKERARILREAIYCLPDDERELWNR